MATDATSPISVDIMQAIAVGNVKSVAEQPAMLSNLALSNLIQNVNLSQQNAVSSQQAMNQLFLTVIGKIVNLLANVNPTEAAAITELFTGNEAAEQIADLKASSPTPEADDKASHE